MDVALGVSKRTAESVWSLVMVMDVEWNEYLCSCATNVATLPHINKLSVRYGYDADEFERNI